MPARRLSIVLAAACALLLAACGGSHQSTSTTKLALGPPIPAGLTPEQLCLKIDVSTHCILNQQPQSKLKLGIKPTAALAYGLDGWGPPSLALSSSSYHFGVAYSSYDPTKDWNAGAVAAFHAKGKGTVVVWETTQGRSTSGYDGGRADAIEAERQANLLGNHTGPIDFAVDWQAPCTFPDLLSYFQGVHSILGSRDQIYGGYDQVLCVFDHGYVGRENWQTLAWSGGRWLPASIAPLEQFGFIGTTYDIDRALAVNYGQWFPRSAPKPKDPYAILDHTRRHFRIKAPSPTFGAPYIVVASEHGTMTTIRARGCHGAPRRPVCKSSKFHLTLLLGRLRTVGLREKPHYKLKGQGARQTIMAKQLARLS